MCKCQHQGSIKGSFASCPGEFEILHAVFPLGLAAVPQVFLKLVAVVAATFKRWKIKPDRDPLFRQTTCLRDLLSKKLSL